MSETGQRVDVASGQVGAVIDRRRAGVDRDPHARARPKLVAVHPQPQSLSRPGGQHPPGLRLVESAVLAEHVDPPHLRRDRVEHRSADQIEVAVGILRKLRRHDMCSQEGDLVESGGLRRPRRTDLVGHRQPVAGLGLHAGGAAGDHLGPVPAGDGQQLRVVRRPGGEPPSTRFRLRCTASRPSGRRTRRPGRRRTRRASASRPSRAAPHDHRHRRRSAAGADDAGPTHPISPSSRITDGRVAHAYRAARVRPPDRWSPAPRCRGSEQFRVLTGCATSILPHRSPLRAR